MDSNILWRDFLASVRGDSLVLGVFFSPAQPASHSQTGLPVKMHFPHGANPMLGKREVKEVPLKYQV